MPRRLSRPNQAPGKLRRQCGLSDQLESQETSRCSWHNSSIQTDNSTQSCDLLPRTRCEWLPAGGSQSRFAEGAQHRHNRPATQDDVDPMELARFDLNDMIECGRAVRK